jgi:hypothetical protein
MHLVIFLVNKYFGIIFLCDLQLFLTIMSVRSIEERKSVGNSGIQAGSGYFNQFVGGNCLIDLPLQGRNFTWFRGDGKSMSRIDRFLLSEKWCLTWPNCFQLASVRGLSDHCPIQLSIDEENWGPKPLRMLKCWDNFSGYNEFVSDRWKSFQKTVGVDLF